MEPGEAAKLIIQELRQRRYEVNEHAMTIEGFPIWFEITPYGEGRLQGRVLGGREEWKVIQNKNALKEAELPFHINMVRHLKIEVDEHLKVGMQGVREMQELMESVGVYSGNPLRLLELFEGRGFNPATRLLIPHFKLEMGKKKCGCCGERVEWYYRLDEPAHYLGLLGLLDAKYCKACLPKMKPEIEKALADMVQICYP